MFDVDVVGGLNIKKKFGDNALSIFIQPPSVEVLRQRLTGRGTDAPEKIEQRLLAAAGGDFAIAIYNPSSHKRKDYLKKACDILLRVIDEERPCGYVENIGREGTKAVTCTLRELRDTQVNMFTTVFIGNSDTELIHGKLITKRGYHIERNTDIK